MNVQLNLHSFDDREVVMATKKSDSTALFPESIEQVQKSMPDDADIEKVVSFYKVLADKTRLRILYAIKEQEMCAGDIAVLLDMTKSAVSHQLAVMRNMHQIKSRRDGKILWIFWKRPWCIWCIRNNKLSFMA